jgi:cobalt-zinc-cadmium efflux system membrane fusion protein
VSAPRRLALLFALLLCSSVPGLGGCGGSEPAPDRDRAPEQPAAPDHAAALPGARTVTIDPEMLRDLRITTARAETRPGGEGASVLGEVRVNEDAYSEVGSAIPARVIRLLASPGERVEPDQPLVELESPEVGQARAEYLAARARSELARRALARKRELVRDRIAAGREVQEAEAEAAAAAALLRAAAAALQALGVTEGDLERSGPGAARLLLRSPIRGTLLDRNATLGQMTDPAQPLCRIADLSTVWLVVHAFERDAVRARLGAAARVELAALPGRSFSGTVAWIGSQVDTRSRTIPIRIEIANPDGALRPGMSATAWLPLGDASAPVVAVPAAALQRTREGWSVFLPREPGVFESRGVGRGRDLGGEIEVVSGLESGEVVVVEGAFLLKAEAEKARGEGEHHDH